ncbi:MAG: sugar O-acetyltransferase [Dermatophilaceae bacterium]
MADDEARAEDAAVHADAARDAAGVEEAGTGGGDPLGDDPRSMWQRLRAGDLHRPEGAEVRAHHTRGMALQEAFNATGAHEGRRRGELLDQLLGTRGKGARIRPPLYVDYGAHLHVGENTFVNYGLTALDVADIRIGRDGQIAPGVQLLTAWHPLDPTTRRAGWEAASPITIGDNVWLGAGAIVLPGVTIGDNTVVGAGALVTKDLPADVLALGSPARVIRHL